MALNFSLDSLLEQSLLTEDPWWVYILNGAWWTIGLTIAAFALALLSASLSALCEQRQINSSAASVKPGLNSSAIFP